MPIGAKERIFASKYRELLMQTPGLYEELDSFMVRLNAFLLVSHYADGTQIVGDPTTNVAPADLAYVTVGNTASLTAERALVGTANEVDVTDNGAGSTVAVGLVASPVVTGLTVSGLTAGRVPFASTGGLLADDADFTFATDTLSATKIASSSLTSGRVPFATTSGLLVDDADFTFATDTLTVTKIAATTFTGNVTLSTKNLVTDTTTGTQIGTGATQKLGFFGATPVVQQPTIADASGTLGDITTKFNTLLAQLENLGLNAST